MQLFWKKSIRYIFAFLLAACLFPVELKASDKQELPKLVIFHSSTCHRCLEVKQDVMPVIESEFKDKVIFEYRDVGQMENYQMALGLLKKSGASTTFRIPLFYLGGKFLGPEDPLQDNLRNFIQQGLKEGWTSALASPVDLVNYFKSFVPATVIVAGLEDGINPCAFTVIVFFISFLSLQGYRKRELILIGSSFILAVFLTYLAIGLGIFNFFYQFKGFWFITHLLNSIIGSLSILFGIFAVYDFIKFKKTGSTDDLILQLPKPIKERIHKVVGFFYRRTNQDKNNNVLPSTDKLMASAFVTGFLVSLLEAVCTGQVYLPTISFVLKTSSLKIQALGYLLLYNILFVIPLIAIFILALLGVSSKQFADFLKRHLGLIKLLMAALFFSLGIFLIWRG